MNQDFLIFAHKKRELISNVPHRKCKHCQNSLKLPTVVRFRPDPLWNAPPNPNP